MARARLRILVKTGLPNACRKLWEEEAQWIGTLQSALPEPCGRRKREKAKRSENSKKRSAKRL